LTTELCPICGRPLGTVRVEGHHLIPKTFKGKVLVDLHGICHRKLHTVFTERELLNYYHTVERIVEHSEMQKFIKWVAKKPPEYYDSITDTQDRRRKRR
jgi:hypothetical protein